jgi:cob(I)alamin adenosyltransferase
MKIYTKTGDNGTTGLFSGERVEKDHPLVAAYGTVDECNSVIGLALSASPTEPVAVALTELQNLLFTLGADMATRPGGREIRRISADDIQKIEHAMDALDAALPKLQCFILPGGPPAAAHLQVARAVCRRAEREAFAASRSQAVNPEALHLLNRLSDYLFLLARRENQLAGGTETPWSSK